MKRGVVYALRDEVRQLMKTRKSRSRQARTGRGEVMRTPSRSADEAFPPLTTSLESFVKDGSDREFRLLVYDLIKLANQLARNRKHFATYMGVTEAQWLMIMIIAETQGATVGHLAQQLNVSSQFVTIEIGDLVKKSIVEKRPNESDRRSMFLSLTPKGKNLLREVAPMLQKANDIMFRSLIPERARVLKEIVSTLIADGATALHELEAPHWAGKKAPSAEPAQLQHRKARVTR